MAEPIQNAVQVTNISPSATEKTVSDFFSFCGKISRLFLDKEEGQETSSAVIEFESESAAKTALLLTNALIVDRPISVVPYSPAEGTEEVEPTPPGTPVAKERITERDFGGVADEDRTKTSVVASLLASGYVLGSDVLSKAQKYDEENSISLKLKVGMEQVKVKAHEIDVQYGISEKASNLKKTASEKASKLDQDYQISEKASNLKKTASEKASKFDQDYQISEKASSAANSVKMAAFQASENPTVKTGVETVKTGWASLASAVTGVYKDYYDQTNRAIEEKKGRPQEKPKPANMQMGMETMAQAVSNIENESEKKEEETEVKEDQVKETEVKETIDSSVPSETVPQ